MKPEEQDRTGQFTEDIATKRAIGSTKREITATNVSRSIAEASGRPSESTRLSLGRYELIREIGRGGYGIVYLADDTQLGRQVAIKIARQEMVADEAGIERFRKESRAAATLDHPGIISVFDCGEENGIHYYVMPFLDAKNLAEWFSTQTEPMYEKNAARLVLELAEAIHFGHQQGVIHRDLKPQNILLKAEPSHPNGFRPVVLDFGLCGLVDSVNTSTSMLAGTPRYMSPEQAMFGFRRVTLQSDIYSIGAILYELLTKQTPHQPTSLAEAVLMLHGEPVVSPCRINHGLSKSIESICLKCLRKDQGRRYDSAQALVNDLRNYLSGDSITARPAGLWERLDFAIRFGGWESRLGTSLIAVNAIVFFWSTFGGFVIAWKFSGDQNVIEGFAQLLAFFTFIVTPVHAAGMYLGSVMKKCTQHYRRLVFAAVASGLWSVSLWNIVRGEQVPMRVYADQGYAQVMVFLMVALAFAYQAICLSAGARAAYLRKKEFQVLSD